MPAPHPTLLSDDELAELDALLLSDEDDRLPIDEAHGFLTAQIISRSPSSDAEIIEEICGDATFENSGDLKRVTQLLLQMRDEIATSLQANEPFEPLVIEEEEDGEIFEDYEGWCFGFMLGVTHQSAQWDNLSKTEEELLAPIAQLALLHTQEEEEEEGMDEEEYALCIELLPGAVNSLYARWDTQ